MSSYEEQFLTADGKQVPLKDVIAKIIAFINADSTRKYKVVIGSDSENFSDNADFVTAIVVHRIGNGGIYFWRRSETPSFHTLRDRIYHEVMLSLEAAGKVVQLLKDKKAPPFDFEIHIDVGGEGETRVLINEVVGMTRGYGFEVKTKPLSFGASKVADRHI